MKTHLVAVSRPKDSVLRKIARDIQKGKLVVFPTETVYGLGANALAAKAVRKIFKAKGRPADNPLIVHVSNQKMLKKLVKKIPIPAQKLMKKFWPGPLTLLFLKSQKIPAIVTAGLATVGIRFPSHSIAQKLISLAGVPIAAPSANVSGKPSASRAEHAFADLNGKVDWIIDSGSAKAGIESTILDMTQTPPVLLRPGAVTREQIEKVIGKIIVHSVVKNPKTKQPKITAVAPGMKYRHYAPKAEVWIVSKEKLLSIAQKEAKRKSVGVISISFRAIPTVKMFYFTSLAKLAQGLFSTFRACDQKKVQIILVENVSSKGIGLAVRNRVQKAASQTIG